MFGFVVAKEFRFGQDLKNARIKINVTFSATGLLLNAGWYGNGRLLV